LSYENVTRRRQ